jgi:hypothetical protein
MAISRYEVARLRTVVRRRGWGPGSLGGGLAHARTWYLLRVKDVKIAKYVSFQGAFAAFAA